MLVHQEFWFVE